MRFYGWLGLCWAVSASLVASSSAQDNGAAVTDIQISMAPKNGIMPQYAPSIVIKGPEPRLSAEGAVNWAAAAAEALKNNPTLLAARLAVAEARQQVKIADAGFLPTVTANADINRGQGTQIFDGGLLTTSSGSYAGNLSGTWNFFNGFNTMATRAEDLAMVDNAQAAYAQASTALYLGLGQAFDQLIYDQQNLKLLKLLVKRYHSDTLYQEQEFKGGLTALWTYEKGQSDEAGEVWSYNEQRYSLGSDQAALAILLGRSGDAADGLAVAGALTVSAAPGDYHVDMARMLAVNPTVAYYATLAKADDAAVWAAESTRYPTIGASGSWGTSGQETWGPRNKEWQGSLNISYELFAGGALEAAITEADQALQAAKQTAFSEQAQTQAAFIKAWIAYITDCQRLPSAAMAVHAGIDRFATVGALYQSGREEFLDYEQAESIYSGAQTQQLSILLAAAEAQVAYRNAVGVTLEQAAATPAP